MSRRDIKHFKYTYNYLIPINKLAITKTNQFKLLKQTKIANKNNKKNRRRAAFYGISKFDYEAKENLTKGQLPKKTSIEEKVIKYSLGNIWTKVWSAKITVIQTNF